MKLSAFLLLCAAGLTQAEQPLLMQHPTLNATHIVFSYAGDLWSVPREGGDAIRLTTAPGVEDNPIFSPDGTRIAFRGEYDGNVDVFLIPAQGGVPKRLTYHPAPDTPVAWSPDGKSVLFRSSRNSYSRFDRLFTMAVDGGFPVEVPLPMAEEGAYSPDGARLAYLPLAPAFQSWKRYRGGRTTPIWIATLSDSRVEKIPRQNSNDFNPLWIGDRVYFLSDRNGPVTFFYYDVKSGKVTQALANNGLDLKSAGAGPGAIVYEQFGGLYLYDLNSGKARQVDVRIAGDLPSVRPHFEKAGPAAQARISPTGARAIFEIHGEVLSVPAEKGDIRNLTNTTAVAERDPSWSPDGKRIAYFSDESGEYQLHLRDQNGMGEPVKIALGDKPGFYYDPTWSPDNRKIAYTDHSWSLWYIDLDKKTPVKIDQDAYSTPARDLNPAWSPDSQWITYTRLLPNHYRALFLYSLATGHSTQVSDGMSDADYAQFDKNGKYLYFTASTNTGLTTAWLDMSSEGHQVTRSVYVAVLSKDEPSPLAPESDEEKAADTANRDEAKKDAAKNGAPPPVKVDLENVGERILALPIPARDYVGLQAGKTGMVYLVEAPQGPAEGPGPRGATVYKFDLKTRKTEKVMDDAAAFDVSQNGEKMLYRQGQHWFISAAGTPAKPGEGALKTDDIQIKVDPRAEWRQMYREVWRIERDYFYDPNHHGLDLQTAAKKYEPYLDTLGSRADFSYLLQEALGELTVGHLYVSGGTQPEVKRVPGGLLGADYAIENGRYRFARIYRGENWNPQLRAPLTQPGVNVAVGDYLLSVNGREVRPPDNLYAFFEQTAGKSVVLRVGPDPSGANSREVTVVPVESETALRNLSWIDENRRKVDQLSGGRLAYVYLPNTAQAGFTNFNRYYFAQIGKQGAVIDERFNGGGQIADYIIDYLNRPLLSFFTTRYGQDFSVPQESIFGPKAMIINEYAGSGGDAMPWMFRRRGIGKLVGKRTWGGLVGIFGFPALIDGGMVTAPNLAFYSTSGEWDVENHGVPPDVEVEYDPAAARAGRDPQLEKAVEVVLGELKAHPLPQYHRPPYPNYHRPLPAAASGK